MNRKKGRKTRKQLLAEKEAISKRLIDEANAQENPLEKLTNFQNYTTPDGINISLTCQRVNELSSQTLFWVFDLLDMNMRDMYEKSGWGWNVSSKKNELTEPNAWYLIARIGEELVGFSHFRYDFDDKVEVVYCYEVQLEQKMKRKGLGRFIMNCLQTLAVQSKMKKVVLTVFKHNPEARAFYEAIGYKLDKTSPADWECLDYIILSK